MEELNKIDTTSIREWHAKDPYDLGGRCVRRDCDRGPWPCDVVRLCDALDARDAELAEHRDQSEHFAMHNKALRAEIRELRAELSAEQQRDDARARLEEIRTLCQIRARQVTKMEPGAEALVNQLRTILDR